MAMTFSILKKSFLGVGLLACAFGVAQEVEASERLVMAERKGDRGMLAPYVHHKNGPGYIFTSYLFDTLIGQDDAGKPIPALASSWSVSKDGLTYTLALNEAVTWHDGTAFTAEDVAFTIEYMQKHPYSFISIANIASYEVMSPHKIQVTLKKRDAGMMTSKLVSLPILAKHIYETIETPARFLETKAAIGTGPYKLVRYEKAQGRYLLERNEAYYGGRPKYEQLAIFKMAPQAALKAMTSGQVDLYNRLPVEDIDAAQKAGLKVFRYVSHHPSRLIFNHRGLFKDKAMRQALAFAIDRQALVDIVYRGKAEIADTGFLQKGTAWYSDMTLPSYAADPAKAADMLTQQGWRKGDDGQWGKAGKTIALRFITSKSFKKMATVLSQQLTAFGFAVELRILEKAAVNAALKKEDFDLSLQTSSTLGDPDSYFHRVFSKSPKSDDYQGDGKMKEMLKKQQQATSAAERRAIVKEFQALYAEELPSYMLINPVWVVAHTDRVQPVFFDSGIAFGIPMAIPKNILMP